MLAGWSEFEWDRARNKKIEANTSCAEQTLLIFTADTTIFKIGFTLDHKNANVGVP